MSVATCDITGAAVPGIFISLRSGKRTGTAVFEFTPAETADQAVKKVYCKNGDVIFAASNLPADWLGRSMVRAGTITQQQCDASEGLVAKMKKKQGVILLELGYITPQKLVDGVKHQVKEIILSLFSIRTGCYRFDEGPLPAADIIPLQVSIGNLILEGIRKLDWQVARKSIPPPVTVMHLSSDPSLLFQKADLTADEAAVMALVDGKRSIEEICALSGIGDFNALRAIQVLLALKMAQAGTAKSDREISLARDALIRQAQAPASSGTSSEKDTAGRMDIEQAFAAVANADHYQALQLDRTADDHAVKHAYFLLAKRYHPDRHFETDMQDLKEKFETLFNRIHDAYEVLRDPERRKAYDAGLDGKSAGHFEERKAEDYVENYAEKAAQALSHFNSGVRDFKAGNFWGAEDAFAWATRLDPVKSVYFLYRGLALARIPRRLHEAEENIQKAIEIDPLKIDYYLELGKLYLKSGSKTKALEVYNSALAQNPDSVKVLEAIKAITG